MSTPDFTVIIATYNWSSALAIAIQSVLNQSIQTFEIWVIGDACTDNSYEVVRSFQDQRVQWINLDQNCGSQWGPNNLGCRVAKGRFIAYLGHDDVWAPNHLATVKACFDTSQTDVIAAATLLFGPAHTGVRAVTGFFPNGRFSPRHFFPPSSLAHRACVSHTIGGWRRPENALIAVDYDFLYRCHQAGFSFAMTGEFTVFKFNAAWSRNSYKTRDASQQQACLAALKIDANAYLLKELTATIRAATEDRLLKIETPLETNVGAEIGAKFNQIFKGSHAAAKQDDAVTLDGPASFARNIDNDVFEWHGLESHPFHGNFKWSGPGTNSQISLPVKTNTPLQLKIIIIGEIEPGLLRQLKLRINDNICEYKIESGIDSQYLVCEISQDFHQQQKSSEICLAFELPRTSRPIDLGINEDRRWLGLAVGWISVDPLATVDTTAD